VCDCRKLLNELKKSSSRDPRNRESPWISEQHAWFFCPVSKVTTAEPLSFRRRQFPGQLDRL